jgi:hypothetical protein
MGVSSNSVEDKVYQIQHYVIKRVSNLRQVGEIIYRKCDKVCQWHRPVGSHWQTLSHSRYIISPLFWWGLYATKHYHKVHKHIVVPQQVPFLGVPNLSMLYDFLLLETAMKTKISTKIYGPKVFLFTKVKPEYSDILYNPTYFPGPLVCRIRHVQLYTNSKIKLIFSFSL